MSDTSLNFFFLFLISDGSFACFNRYSVREHDGVFMFMYIERYSVWIGTSTALLK